MSDDFRRPPDHDGADGWVDPYARTEYGLDAVQGPGAPPPRNELVPRPKPPNTVEEGKAMSLVAHTSALLGLPLFLIPLLQKENDFALHHAKAAGVNFVFFYIIIGFGLMTCGIGLLLLPLCYLPMIVGFVKAINGELAGPWAWGGLGERMFSGVQLDESRMLE